MALVLKSGCCSCAGTQPCCCNSLSYNIGVKVDEFGGSCNGNRNSSAEMRVLFNGAQIFNGQYPPGTGAANQVNAVGWVNNVNAGDTLTVFIRGSMGMCWIPQPYPYMGWYQNGAFLGSYFVRVGRDGLEEENEIRDTFYVESLSPSISFTWNFQVTDDCRVNFMRA